MTFLKFSVLDKNIKDSSINNRIINKEKIFYYQVVKIKKKTKNKKTQPCFSMASKRNLYKIFNGQLYFSFFSP